MKKLAAIGAVLVLGLALATPAMAGHRGRGGGHKILKGTFLGVRAAPIPHFRAPRLHSSISLGFGYPVYYPVHYRYHYYRPVPVYYGPPPVVVVEDPCDPVWIPGHYARRDGIRFWVAGYWSHDH